MSQDVNDHLEENTHPIWQKGSTQRTQGQWFTTPPIIKRLFNNFPLHTYAPNELPQRTAPDRSHHSLYIFTTREAARLGSPSYNPSCLKWQTYLKFLEIEFSTIVSNNHASPTGALPFLIPSSSLSVNPNNITVPSTGLQQWARSQISKSSGSQNRRPTDFPKSSGPELKNDKFDNENFESEKKHLDQNGGAGEVLLQEPSGMRYEAYMSLLDNRIRKAWLYFLYLEPSNFAAVAYPLYIFPCSLNTLVRTTLAYNLRVAAKSELLKKSAVVDVEALYRECDSAFFALSQFLGNDKYFFAAEKPSLFDASVFAYTNPLLDDGLDWRETRIRMDLMKYKNLTRHREIILQRYF